MWSRVLKRAFERLELLEGELSRAVLRGGDDGNIVSLPDRWKRAEFRKPLGMPGRSEQHQYLAGGLLHVAGVTTCQEGWENQS